MRIMDNERSPLLRKGESGKRTAQGSAGTLFSMFSNELETCKADIDNYQQNLEELRQDLDRAGEKLEGEPTLTNFKRFRELLSQLAKRVSNEAYRLEKIGGTPMNPRYYEIITVIDKEADKLYQMIVKDQKDRMAITASVIGIKGLVVDLIT